MECDATTPTAQPRARVALSASLLAAAIARAPPLAKPLWSHGALVRSLGTVVWDVGAFHSRTMIWPVGFRSTRELRSLNHSGRRAVYTSEIMVLDNRPLFRVTASDEPAAPIDAWDPTSAWAMMLQRLESRWPGVRLPLRTSFGMLVAPLPPLQRQLVLLLRQQRLALPVRGALRLRHSAHGDAQLRLQLAQRHTVRQPLRGAPLLRGAPRRLPRSQARLLD